MIVLKILAENILSGTIIRFSKKSQIRLALKSLEKNFSLPFEQRKMYQNN